MTMSSSILFILAGLISLFGAILIWRDAIKRKGSAGDQPAGFIAALVAVAIVLNVWAIHLIGSLAAEGINFTLATGVAVPTLIVQAIYVFGILRHGIHGLGLLLLPATAIPLFLIPVLPEANTPNWVHTTSILETGHLLISLIAYAVLTLAAIHAVMQILLSRALKKKRMTTLVQSLPSLMDIERHMFAQVKGATCLIAISILSGLVWQWVEFHRFALLNHKVLLALFSFAVLLLLLIKRHRASWPTRVASRAVLAAYCLLMLAYFGVKLIHSWIN
jgi:ABC-type uncharacterized transport system permease subunit